MLYQGNALTHQDPVIKWAGRIFTAVVVGAVAWMFVWSLLASE